MIDQPLHSSAQHSTTQHSNSTTQLSTAQLNNTAHLDYRYRNSRLGERAYLGADAGLPTSHLRCVLRKVKGVEVHVGGWRMGLEMDVYRILLSEEKRRGDEIKEVA